MNIIFRDYEEKDKSVVLELVDKLEQYIQSLDPIHRIKNLPGFTKKSFAETLENVAKYRGKILLAQDNEQIIGYAIGVIWEQSEKNKLEIGPHVLGEVLDIYVDDAYRGHRIGSTMLQQMEDYFTINGCDSMWVGVFAANKRTHDLYKKFGFSDREIGMLKELNTQ